MRPKDWADMRVFQAIYEKGSLSSAASYLDLTQPSVGRRLTDMEERFGTTLFVRSGRRMEPTDVASALYHNALAMEQEMLAVERTVEVQSTQLAGLVRITATEGLGSEWLAPYLYEFSEKHPEIELEVIVSNQLVDLVHREADIAIRFSRPTEPDLIAKKLVPVEFGLYASRSYIQRAGPISSYEDLKGHDLSILRVRDSQTGMTNQIQGNLEAFIPHMKIRFATNSPTAVVASTRAGFGLGILSRRWAHMFDDLVPILPDETIMTFESWLVTHEELRHSARIRAVFDFLAEKIMSKYGAAAMVAQKKGTTA